MKEERERERERERDRERERASHAVPLNPARSNGRLYFVVYFFPWHSARGRVWGGDGAVGGRVGVSVTY